MRTLVAFLRRDLRESRSYFGSWVMEGSSIVLTVLTFYFLGKLVDQNTAGSLPSYGRSYFAFAIQGIAVTSLLHQVVRGHTAAIRQAQLTGTFESMLMAPVPTWQIPLGGSLHALVRGWLRLAAYLLLASALVPVPTELRLGWLGAVLLLATLSFLPFGLLAASYTVLFKRGDPVAHLTHAATLLLAGVYFPPDVLPAWLQPASHAFPVTHAVTALRSATQSDAALQSALVWLVIFSVIAVPLSLWLFDVSVSRARKVGSLAQM